MELKEQLIIVIKHKFSLGVILTYWLGNQSKNNFFLFLPEISWFSRLVQMLFSSSVLESTSYHNQITHTHTHNLGLDSIEHYYTTGMKFGNSVPLPTTWNLLRNNNKNQSVIRFVADAD